MIMDYESGRGGVFHLAFQGIQHTAKPELMQPKPALHRVGDDAGKS